MFLLNESIQIDSHNESNQFESQIGMLYYVRACVSGDVPNWLVVDL